MNNSNKDYKNKKNDLNKNIKILNKSNNNSSSYSNLNSAYNKKKVRNENSIPIDIKYTRNGPLIPNNLIPKEYVNLNFDFQDSLNISFRSAFYQFPFENFDFYIKFNLYSKNYEDILPYIDKAVAPNYNAHYASINGDIGWVPLGRIAIKNYYNRFCKGYDPKDDILKYIPRNEIYWYIE